MPFSRPTRQSILSRTRGDIASALDQQRLLPGIAYGLAGATANLSHGLHGHIAAKALNLVPNEQMEPEALEQWARAWGLSRRPPAAARGDIIVTGVNGSVVPAGSVLIRADAVQYTTDSQATIAAGTATIPITASTLGATTNAEGGTSLTFGSPIIGVDSQATVGTDGLRDGTDLESDLRLFERLQDEMSDPPQAGSRGDWIRWAKEVTGVTRVWPFRAPPVVTVRFATDDDPGGPIPSDSKRDEVEAYLLTKRPLNADLVVEKPTAVVFEPQLSITPDSPQVRAAVTLALEDLLYEEGGCGETVYLSHMHQAISTAEGEFDHTIIWPVVDYRVSDTNLLVMGTPQWS